MTQLEVLLNVTKTLNKKKIPYMLTGAYAVSFYGKPRTTHDIDLKVLISNPDVDTIYEAFKKDFYIDKDMINQAVTQENMFNIIHNETQTKIDFWLLRNDEFDITRFKRKMKINIHNTPVFISTAEDMIIIKLCWYKESNSQKHYEDIKGILEIQAGRLDMKYINKWAGHFSATDILTKIAEKVNYK